MRIWLVGDFDAVEICRVGECQLQTGQIVRGTSQLRLLLCDRLARERLYFIF
jgi:hypothetical protein